MNKDLRELFPITERAVYLNHAAVSAPPLPTIHAIESQLLDVVENGSLHYRRWVATKERARKLAAAMLGARRPDQVAFMRNTSDALSTVANGLKWQPGDNVVTFRSEFPSNVYPWLRLRNAYGVEVRFGEERDGRIDLNELINLIDARTRVVAISLVQYASGFRVDTERLARAARRYDALLVVDVIQAMGVLPIDVEAQLIDVAAGACHKWLLTPEGIGLLYLSDRARARIEPTLVGWVSVPHPEEYSDFSQTWREQGALAWETGTGPTAMFYGLEASLKLLSETGVAHIANHLAHLTDQLCELLAKNKDYRILSSRLAAEKSQIVCLQNLTGKTPSDIYAHLKQQNIIAAPRGDRLRVSPHFYNISDEIEILVNNLP